VIYLDYHAAAPMPESVRRAMREAMQACWANASSSHQAGRASKALLEDARSAVARSLGASPADVVLTAGGTEACNLGLRGLAEGRRRVVTTEVEHPAVSESVDSLRREGREVLALPVPGGQPFDAGKLAELVDAQTLVALQWVNHETGALFPIAEYAAVCQELGARLFVDATQALGKLPIDVESLGLDAMAVAAQKIGGPAGAGACWVRRGLDLAPVAYGGTQERGRRPGTLDSLSMTGFAAACAGLEAKLAAQSRIGRQRDALENRLSALGGAPNQGAPRVATVSNLSFRGWEGAVLVAALDLEGVCVSTGAACSSGLQEPSAVLRAMYPHEQWRARSAVRVSLGFETTDEEIHEAFQAFERVLKRAPLKT
jgi:cysteine desulfurase